MTQTVREQAFEAIDNERAYQENKWGTTDTQNTPYHWASYIGAYSTRSLVGAPNGFDVEAFKKDMIKVAALAVAAVEKL